MSSRYIHHTDGRTFGGRVFARLLSCVQSALALLLASFFISHPSFSQESATEFPLTRLSVGIHLILAEVAANPSQHQKGLMFREKLGANQGMVFFFDHPALQCMWMKNTLLPLSVAFISEDGTILNIADMQPQTLTNHCAVKPVPYALEMNLGWFAKRGIKPGSKISGLPALH